MFSKGGLISEIADLNFVAVHAPCWRALARKANPLPAGLSEPGSAYLSGGVAGGWWVATYGMIERQRTQASDGRMREARGLALCGLAVRCEGCAAR